jgi:hypothetical protein
VKLPMFRRVPASGRGLIAVLAATVALATSLAIAAGTGTAASAAPARAEQVPAEAAMLGQLTGILPASHLTPQSAMRSTSARSACGCRSTRGSRPAPLSFAGAPDFSPTRIATPGPNGFPLAKFQPGSRGPGSGGGLQQQQFRLEFRWSRDRPLDAGSRESRRSGPG